MATWIADYWTLKSSVEDSNDDLYNLIRSLEDKLIDKDLSDIHIRVEYKMKGQEL